MFGDLTAKITVYTPYIYGSGQPYSSDTLHSCQPSTKRNRHVLVEEVALYVGTSNKAFITYRNKQD